MIYLRIYTAHSTHDYQLFSHKQYVVQSDAPVPAESCKREKESQHKLDSRFTWTALFKLVSFKQTCHTSQLDIHIIIPFSEKC